MNDFNIAYLVKEKMKEVEKQSNEAWKFTDFKHESFVKSVINRLSFFKRSQKQYKQNNGICVCEC